MSEKGAGVTGMLSKEELAHFETIARYSSTAHRLLAHAAALAERLSEIETGYRIVSYEVESLSDKLTTEKGMRLGAEVRTAEILGMLKVEHGRLGDYLNTVVADLHIEGKGQYFRDLFGKFEEEAKALASTDDSAGAVLAAASTLEEEYEAWANDPNPMEQTASVETVLGPFFAKVRAWRTRREGNDG